MRAWTWQNNLRLYGHYNMRLQRCFRYYCTHSTRIDVEPKKYGVNSASTATQSDRLLAARVAAGGGLNPNEKELCAETLRRPFGSSASLPQAELRLCDDAPSRTPSQSGLPVARRCQAPEPRIHSRRLVRDLYCRYLSRSQGNAVSSWY